MLLFFFSIPYGPYSLYLIQHSESNKEVILSQIITIYWELNILSTYCYLFYDGDDQINKGSYPTYAEYSLVIVMLQEVHWCPFVATQTIKSE